MNDAPLMLSGLQHFAFCRRQWALIHIEQQWVDNWRTVDGEQMHARTHDEKQAELRGDILTIRGMRIGSRRMNISGICDVVEFHRDPKGVALYGREGLWQPYPIEYKRGEPKPHNADEMQLCAQAMCLEEMLSCEVPQGALFYGETHRRTEVVFSCEMRSQVENMFAEMHQHYVRGHTPAAKRTKACNACSLKDLCLPALSKRTSVEDYLRRMFKEDGL